MSLETPVAIRTRSDLGQFADSLLLAVRPYASAGHARITLPGTPGGYGTAVDGLEGFARTFLLAGFRLAGEQGADPNGYAEWYRRGLVAGTDPASPDRWVRPSEHPQAKVEAASLALILDLTREWIWDRLGPTEQERVVDYLAEIVGDETYPRNNWLWFRVVVETFLRSVGGPHRLSDIRADLERHDEFYECHGWYRDGDERAYDHYVGWAMHLYPTLWARMRGATDLAEERADLDRQRLGRYLLDAIHLVGADGAPLFQGRSLVYRFAAAAPFWAGAIAQVPTVAPGRLGRTALSIVDHFVQRGLPNRRGLLDLGWHGPWRRLAQRYSGTGSPYWASKGLLGLLLPADHPVWADAGATLTGQDDDATGSIRAIHAPGWLAGPGADGTIARISNHGTDHAQQGARSGDSPLYARLAYSTSTAPLLDPAAWESPIDQSVALVDADGRRSHRSGMTTLGVRAEGDVGAGASRSDVHWVSADPAEPDHGSGRSGSSSPAGTVAVYSVVRGDWEVRLVRLERLQAGAVGIQAGGWALSDDAGVQVRNSKCRVDTAAGQHRAALVGLLGWQQAAAEHHDDATPLGAHSAVGVLHAPAETGWYACALGLSGTGELGDAPTIEFAPPALRVSWPDGARTAVALPNDVIDPDQTDDLSPRTA